MNISIRPVKQSDAACLARIYNHYVSNTCVTFDADPVSAEKLSQRISKAVQASLPWLVAEDSDGVVGHTFATPWNACGAYRFSVESNIYLDGNHIGKGIGSRLYAALIAAIRATSMHVVIGGINLPNEQSVRLHERLGFKKVAHFEQVAFKHDRWIDVGYWQLLL